MSRRFVRAELVADPRGLRLILSRYGQELHSEVCEGNNSGAIERSNQRRAISRAEAWCESNGYGGINEADLREVTPKS